MFMDSHNKTLEKSENQMKDSRLLDRRFLFYFCLVVMLLFAVVLLDYDMGQGPWAFSDSAQYIISGQNLMREGRLGIYAPDGHFMLLTLHPPLYSLVLAPFTVIDADIFVVIKWMNILFFCAALVLISVGIFKLTASPIFGGMVGIAFLTSTSLVKVFDGAMTEPLFVSLTVLNLILIGRYLVKPSRGVFWAAVITAGLAPLARYIGVVSIGVGIILLLMFSVRPWKKRLGQAAGYGVISSVPIGVWFLYTFLQNRNLGSRTFNLSVDMLNATGLYKKALMETLTSWLPFQNSWFPSWESKSTALLVLGSITGVLLILVLWKWMKSRDAHNKPMIILILASLIYIVGFLGFLWISLFSSVQPDYNERMFTPLLPMIYIVLFGVILGAIKLFKLSPVFYLIPLIVLGVLAKSNWIMTISLVNERHVNQIGYATPEWRRSPLVAAVRDLPPGIPLYSNKADAVLLYTGKYPYSVKLLDAEKISVPENQNLNLSETSQQSDQAVLILFTRTLSGDSPNSLKGLSGVIQSELATITPYLTTGDGVIYLLTMDPTNPSLP